MKLSLSTYRYITETCLWMAVLSAILFDKLPNVYQPLAGSIGILAAIVSIATYFYNHGFFDREIKQKNGVILGRIDD